jgi:hypothetical protein
MKVEGVLFLILIILIGIIMYRANYVEEPFRLARSAAMYSYGSSPRSSGGGILGLLSASGSGRRRRR